VNSVTVLKKSGSNATEVDMPESAIPTGEASADQAVPPAVLPDVSLIEGKQVPVLVATPESPADPVGVPANADRAWLWLRRGDQIFVWLMVVLLLTLLGIHWLRLSRWGRVPVELRSQKPREYFYTLDINTASWVEWAQLDGIGEKLARRIIADRDDRGPFRNPTDVGGVRGIGPKILEKIRPFLRGGTESPDPPRSLSTGVGQNEKS
jgi:competence protein ComEA